MTRKIASRSAAVALALGALTSVALAEHVELTDAQMDRVSAGAWGYDAATGSLYDVHRNAFTYNPASGGYLDPDGRVWYAHNGIYANANGSADGVLSWYGVPAPSAPPTTVRYDGQNVAFPDIHSPRAFENLSWNNKLWDVAIMNSILNLGR